MAAHGIDLSGGLIPSTPPSSGAMDLSAGLVAAPSAAGPPPTSGPNLADNPNDEGTYEMKGPKGDSLHVPYSKVGNEAHSAGYQLTGGQTWYGAPSGEAARYFKDYAADPKAAANAKETYKAVQDPGQGVVIGAARGAALTAAGLAHITRKVTGTTDSTTNAEKGAKEFGEGNDTGAEEAGKFIESAAEFMLGDEALKGLSYTDRLKQVMPALKALEKSPWLAKAADAAIQQGTVGTVQATAHGASPVEALETGAVTGGTGGAVTALGEGIGAARGAQAARETAAAERETTQAAYENRGTVTKQRTEAMRNERQATAQQGVRDVVKDSARRVADRVNEAMEPQIGITGETVEGHDFEPIKSDELAGRVNNFGDLADETRKVIKPIIDKLDEASDGELGRLQTERAQAFKNADRIAQADAEKKIDELANEHRDAVTPEQYKAWRTSYADSKVLDSLHDATEKSFNGLSEEMAAQPGTGARKLRGTPYQNQLGKFLQNYGDTRVSRILGEDGLANLHRAANLVSSPETRKATMDLAEQVAAEFPKPAEPAPESSLKDTIAKTGAKMAGGAAVGAAISHVTGLPHLVTEPAGAAAAAGAKYVLQKMVTSPRIGQLMEYAVRNKVTPKVAAGLISAAIIQENQPQQEEKKEEQR